MLERASLFLEPLRPGAAGAFRAIRDAQTQEVLGHAIRDGGTRWSWLAPRAWSIFEEPDGSLLASVRRPWRWSRDRSVFDAEQVQIAVLWGRQILDCRGRVAAERPVQLFAGTRLYRTYEGIEVAALTDDPSGTLLEFRECVADEPLMKIALLAAAVTG